MEEMIAWLTSTFGAAAPDVAASMGIEPPPLPDASGGMPTLPPANGGNVIGTSLEPAGNFNDRFGAISDPRSAPPGGEAMPFAAEPAAMPTPIPVPRPVQAPVPSLGASLEPNIGAQTADGTGIQGVAPYAGVETMPKAQPNLNQLTGALRGMVPPVVPAAQKVGTPAAPRLADIKGDQLLQLLMLAQSGGGLGDGGRKQLAMPSTLGQALGGR